MSGEIKIMKWFKDIKQRIFEWNINRLMRGQKTMPDFIWYLFRDDIKMEGMMDLFPNGKIVTTIKMIW